MNSLRNILCPVDFSEPSYRAIEQASFLAQMLQADLTLMHVVSEHLPGKLGLVHGPDQASQSMIANATEDARTLLREAKRKYVPFAINCRSAVRYGHPITEILAEATERGSGMIFIPGDLAGVDGASSGLSLLQGASVPVLFCRNLSEEKGFRKIVLALSQEHTIKEIAAYVLAHFNLMMQRLHVLVPGGEDADERMVQWDQDLKNEGLKDFSSQFVSRDLLVEEWLHAGTEKGSQLIVVPMAGAKDKAANQRIQSLLQKSTISVLVWRATAVAQAAGS